MYTSNCWLASECAGTNSIQLLVLFFRTALGSAQLILMFSLPKFFASTNASKFEDLDAKLNAWGRFFHVPF